MGISGRYFWYWVRALGRFWMKLVLISCRRISGEMASRSTTWVKMSASGKSRHSSSSTFSPPRMVTSQ